LDGCIAALWWANKVAKKHGKSVAAELAEKAAAAMGLIRTKEKEVLGLSEKFIYRSTSSFGREGSGLLQSSSQAFLSTSNNTGQPSSVHRSNPRHRDEFVKLVSRHREESSLLRRPSNWNLVRKMQDEGRLRELDETGDEVYVFVEGDRVRIIKNGTQKQQIALVTDPDWSGRVKVITEASMATKSYLPEELELVENAKLESGAGVQQQEKREEIHANTQLEEGPTPQETSVRVQGQGEDKRWAVDARVRVIKEGSKKGELATVVEVDWHGTGRVLVLMGEDQKSYLPYELEDEEPRAVQQVSEEAGIQGSTEDGQELESTEDGQQLEERVKELELSLKDKADENIRLRALLLHAVKDSAPVGAVSPAPVPTVAHWGRTSRGPLRSHNGYKPRRTRRHEPSHLTRGAWGSNSAKSSSRTSSNSPVQGGNPESGWF
jgi:hypothetical protein